MKNGTSWEEVTGFIEDESRSGKKKRRLAHSCASPIYNVHMRFTYPEFRLFDEWYRNVTKRGFFSFSFPKIDSKPNELLEEEYQFVKDSAPKYSNVGGEMIDCTMVWEKV